MTVGQHNAVDGTIRIGDAQPPANHELAAHPPITRPGAKVKLEPLQLAADTVLLCLLVIGLILTAVILSFWSFRAPPYPAGAALTEVSMQLYERLSDPHQQRHRELLHVVVASAFLPLVTALIGYLFGVQSSGNSDQPGHKKMPPPGACLSWMSGNGPLSAAEHSQSTVRKPPVIEMAPSVTDAGIRLG